MEIRVTRFVCLASISLVASAPTAAPAAQPASRQVQAADANVGAEKSPQPNRAQMSSAFSSKWSIYVQRIYGVPADIWVQRMAPNLATADANNLRNALQRDTFEGAMAELSGGGAKLSDDKVISILATSKGSNPTPQALGALSDDLVYTPIQPCRILDTRIAGGVITSNSARNFKAVNASDFVAQGGSATNCGTFGLNATAVAVNLTAVTPAAPGFATAYPFGTTRPLAASINYAASAIVNNGLIIQIPNPLAVNDFTLYTLAQSHYVADIIGYFAPPVATALDCVAVTDSFAQIAASNGGGTTMHTIMYAPVCPAGYSASVPYCWNKNNTGVFLEGSGLEGNSASGRAFCAWANTNISAKGVSDGAQCCRVPGR